MKEIQGSFFGVLCMLNLLLPGSLSASVQYDSNNPQLAFAAQEITSALKEIGREDLRVSLSIKPDGASPEAFQIQRVGSAGIKVTGSDANGAMYGGIEVAEYLKLGLPIENVSREPFLEKRGIKFNIPLDVRNPSYDDSGDAAQENIVNMWDFEGFWKPYIDGLARYRYNTLSLWTCHPYPQMVKLADYPDCAAQDVYKAKAGALDHESKGRYFTKIFMMKKGQHNWVDGCLDTNGDGHLTPEDGTIELVKKMTIDEKIAHWTKVFKHAGDRGIQVTLFHWNVNVHGAKGHYGIEADQTNPKTIAYMRAAVKELVLTYPAITAIGVAAGETDDEELKGDLSTEAFIYKTYGLGVMDAQKERPDREIRFIWRNHSTEMEDVEEQFTSKYTGGPVDVSVKYVVGRIHSSRRPQEWEKRALKAGWLGQGYRIWLNLRNDDLFMHRWGSPDYVRQFIRNMPLEHSPGFMLGSDGYVWGKVFYSTVPELQGQLELDKHWYNFRMWGEMAYNNELGDDYWTAALKHRFSLNSQSAELLHDTWQTISEVVPQINRAVYEGTDYALAPEGCIYGGKTRTGFLTIPSYYYGEGQKSLRRLPQKLKNPPPAGEKPCISIPVWGKAYMNGKHTYFGDDKLTPLQVADNLDRWADVVDAALPRLKSKVGGNVELRDLLWDIESMALLGRYYADKQRCAAKYWVYRESDFDNQYKELHEESIDHIKAAESHWEAYAAVLDKHYKPQLLARTHYLDWNSTLNNGEGSGRDGQALGVKQETQDIINRKYVKPKPMGNKKKNKKK
ncbi:hypothetical protein [Pontiella sulfatireligans]|uniref:Beta-hexosaminidase bacterial type N-terminal domain-containing protein n=1 Tax=Pontiella sulfatireligans TaxID=2750658 RepID=A0A6C2UTC1_9BACT|nr:hypothetical protein [Pontiella sulfatireligans]VGO23518.1 hypothetical protein SCARR_05625 [Pontiella sulfatireligans]